jgi:hypothetical protein
MKAPEAYLFSPAHPKLPRQLVLRVGYVEDAFEARTMHGKRRVSARQGRAGEKGDFFSILRENPRQLRPDTQSPPLLVGPLSPLFRDCSNA